MLKHDKPNKCDIPGCSRVDGFSTINDLQRHKKSKHGIGIDTITTSFKCASPSCKNQAKIWPRRDNFKQHILRMHKDEDVNALISRCVSFLYLHQPLLTKSKGRRSRAEHPPMVQVWMQTWPEYQDPMLNLSRPPCAQKS